MTSFYQMPERTGTRKKLYIFLKSNGGNGQASLRIVSLKVSIIPASLLKIFACAISLSDEVVLSTL